MSDKRMARIRIDLDDSGEKCVECFAFAESIDALCAELRGDLHGLWAEYAQEEDSALSQQAVDLKNLLRAIFAAEK